MHWKTEVHSFWEITKKIVFNINQHHLIDPDFVSFGQAFNTELYSSATLGHGSRVSLMAIKTVGKSLCQTQRWLQFPFFAPHLRIKCRSLVKAPNQSKDSSTKTNKNKLRLLLTTQKFD